MDRGMYDMIFIFFHGTTPFFRQKDFVTNMNFTLYFLSSNFT
jgi:hypothetical protein